MRSVAPDANLNVVLYSIFKSGIDGEIREIKNLCPGERYLTRQHLHRARQLPNRRVVEKDLGGDVKGRTADLKRASADRCPRALGTYVKATELQYHHEVYNRFLWDML